MTQIAALLLLADRYCLAANIAPATLSTRLFNDGKRIALLRSGGDIGTRQYARAMEWFKNNWPKDADWSPEIEQDVTPLAFPPVEGRAA